MYQQQQQQKKRLICSPAFFCLTFCWFRQSRERHTTNKTLEVSEDSPCSVYTNAFFRPKNCVVCDHMVCSQFVCLCVDSLVLSVPIRIFHVFFFFLSPKTNYTYTEKLALPHLNAFQDVWYLWWRSVSAGALVAAWKLEQKSLFSRSLILSCYWLCFFFLYIFNTKNQFTLQPI